MRTIEILLVIVSLLTLGGVTYLVTAALPQLNGRRKRLILVDTSALMDGRIVPVVRGGFIGGTLVIPRTVIGELQLLADGADHEKRERARAGLDTVRVLQELPDQTVEILQDGSRAHEGVDERLLILAKKYRAALFTIDFNLNKVATVEGIQVLNLNELAQALRLAYLPGETTMLDLVQKGQDNHQAVGYLNDGTMVVVEQAKKYIGSQQAVVFTRSLQTAAGKMMFAKLASNANIAQSGQQNPDRRQASKKSEPAKPHRKLNSSREKTRPLSKPKTVTTQRSNKEDALVELANR